MENEEKPDSATSKEWFTLGETGVSSSKVVAGTG